MIIIDRYEIKGLPFLEVVEEVLKNKALPTVFFYHGWTNCKEAMVVNGYEIARKGMRAIIPDALFHGERTDGKEIAEHFGDFADIVMNSVDEFELISNYLVEEKMTISDKIGVTGLSMGGITTCAIMRKYETVKAADCLMGAPNFHDFVVNIAKTAFDLKELPSEFDELLRKLKQYDLSLNPEKISNRHFHFWHGTADEVVPYKPTFDFYKTQKEHNFGQNLTFTTTEDGHRVPYNITLEMADYFSKVL